LPAYRVVNFSKAQFLNVLLRVLPLAAKLALTFYMGRYLSLAEIGTYGLVFGACMILSSVLGQGFGYVVARDIVGVPPVVALHKMRDQALLYGANYLALAGVAFVLIECGINPVAPEFIIFTVVITMLEGYAEAVYANMNSLNQQLMGSVLYFVRAGLWVIPAVLLGLLNPEWRTAEIIVIAWISGVAASLLAALWVWRRMPWRESMRRPIDWNWLRNGLKKSSLIWLGAMGINGGVYVDRFIIEHYLGIEDVGIATFYSSFAYALLPLTQSGILAFATPRLIALHGSQQIEKFDQEVRQATKQVALAAGIAALALAVIVPALGVYTHPPALLYAAPTLWLMLSGTWIRSNAETISCVLYARHQDRAIWLGNFLFLIPALGGNAFFVPLLGLPGIGCSTILAASFLLLWRFEHVRQYDKKKLCSLFRKRRSILGNQPDKASAGAKDHP